MMFNIGFLQQFIIFLLFTLIKNKYNNDSNTEMYRNTGIILKYKYRIALKFFPDGMSKI